jgi:hypothetical protein
MWYAVWPRAGITQSVEEIARGWTVQESNPGGGDIFRTRPDWPTSMLYNGYRVFPGGKAAGAWRWPPSSAEGEGGVELAM